MLDKVHYPVAHYRNAKNIRHHVSEKNSELFRISQNSTTFSLVSQAFPSLHIKNVLFAFNTVAIQPSLGPIIYLNSSFVASNTASNTYQSTRRPVRIWIRGAYAVKERPRPSGALQNLLYLAASQFIQTSLSFTGLSYLKPSQYRTLKRDTPLKQQAQLIRDWSK